MFEAYRVRHQFGWNGWHFAPRPEEACGCSCGPRGWTCTGKPGTYCVCRDRAFCRRCSCRLAKETFAGDIFIVAERDYRLGDLFYAQFVEYDASLPAIDELLKKPQYKRLTDVAKRESSG